MSDRIEIHLTMIDDKHAVIDSVAFSNNVVKLNLKR